MLRRTFRGLIASVALGLAVCGGPSVSLAGGNGPTGPSTAVVSTPKATNGSVKCTADINSDGSVLSCKHCNIANTTHLATGEYQVEFNRPCTNILAVNGWSRWVQVDNLSTSSQDAYC